MWRKEDFLHLERRLEEFIKRGVVPKKDIKTLLIYYFFNMNTAKLRKYLNLYSDLFREGDREIRWLGFMLKFLAMEPLSEPKEPLQAFFYYLYYRGDPDRAKEVLDRFGKTIFNDVPPELYYSLYIQVYNFMGRLYVIPENIMRNLHGPMNVYLDFNRFVAGDTYALLNAFRPGKFEFALSHPFSKRLTIIGRMITALMEEDLLTYEIMLRNFEREGEKYLYTAGLILGSMFDPSFSVSDEDIPEYVRFLRMARACILGSEKCDIADIPMGMESFIWHIRKIRDKRVFLSFGGKLRLLNGIKEIHLSRRKALVILAVLRSAGTEGLRSMAKDIFPNSANPMKTVYDYMRFIREYRYAPTNLKFTLHSGSFLYDETEPWANALKDKLRRTGDLKPPVFARPPV